MTAGHMDVQDPPQTLDEQVADQAVAGRSLKQLAWARLRRDKVAMISLGTVIAIVLIAVFAPLLTRLLGVDPYQFNTDQVPNIVPDGSLGGISLAHPLGIEPGTGRDILARLLYGSRVSLLVAITATILTVVLGVVLGTIAGYVRGPVDIGLNRLMDIILAFPQLLLLLALSPVVVQRLGRLGPLSVTGNTANVTYIILVLSLFGWPYLARIVRGQVLSLREREFVEAAVSMGAGTPRILFKELIPNLWAPVLVYTSLLLPGYITAEATLSFLGVGVLPPTPTWGKMLADSVSYFTVDPAYLFIPGGALFIVVLAFNLFGDAVRDALDPRAGRL